MGFVFFQKGLFSRISIVSFCMSHRGKNYYLEAHGDVPALDVKDAEQQMQYVCSVLLMNFAYVNIHFCRHMSSSHNGFLILCDIQYMCSEVLSVSKKTVISSTL